MVWSPGNTQKALGVPFDDDLRQRAVARGDQRRAARLRLDGNQAERFAPTDGKQHAGRPLIERRQLRLGEQASVLNVSPVDVRFHFRVVEPLILLLDQSGQQQSTSGASCDFDGDVRALFRRKSAREEEVVVLLALDWERIEADTVVHGADVVELGHQRALGV